MDSLIETFHIDYKLLIAQAVNFAIVFAVLYFFILKPLLKTMQDRSNKIELSLQDADRIEVELKKTGDEYKRVIGNAKKDANILIEKAQAMADVKKEEMIQKAKEEIGALINKEKAKLLAEKEETLRDIKAEVSSLVIAVTEKLLAKKFDHKTDQEMINKLIKEQ
jgi:F-type H+-transporting ATPase subunit b